jgi:hypothetical protein
MVKIATTDQVADMATKILSSVPKSYLDIILDLALFFNRVPSSQNWGVVSRYELVSTIVYISYTEYILHVLPTSSVCRTCDPLINLSNHFHFSKNL